ncbi:MAG: hypothetical protein ABIO24_13980 [Saprospiraceae bacterium]
MDLLKTKIYLDKLNREFARLSKDPENIARIDEDIVASYVRELYDAVLSMESAPNVARPETPAVPTTTRRPAAPRPSPVVAPAPVPSVPVAPPPPVRETPFVPPPPAPVQQPPVYVEEKPAPVAPSQPEVVMAPKTSSYSNSPEAEALFEEKQAKELSEKLSELPIPDLKKAIALNDRLLLTRELFAGDGQAFESTLLALNGFTHFDDAKTYLLEQCVIRYGWLDKKRVEVVKNFIKLVRRRYK